MASWNQAPWQAYVEIEGDDPKTESTFEAWEMGIAAARQQLGEFTEFYCGPQLRINTDRGYVAVIVGQRSATANGKQGLHPKRIEELRKLGAPVWLVFIDGSVIWSCWPHAIGPELTENIAKDTAQRRQGWKCEDLTRRTLLEFPQADDIPDEVENLFTMGG